jgi:hypothetical protein
MKSSPLVVIAFLTLGLAPLTAGPSVTSNDAYGIVEVGASGIKGQVVRPAANSEDGSPVEYVKEYAPVEGNAFELTAAGSDRIKTTVDSIRKEMDQEFHLVPSHFYLVGSSGLTDEAKAVLSAIDFGIANKIDFVTPEQESVFLFRGTVSPAKAPEVVSLDIGSGNSKGAYLEKSQPKLTFATFAVPWGTKTAAKYVTKIGNSRDFAQAADEFRTQVLLPAIRAETEQYPGMQNRRYIYLSGGIVWAMETLLHPFQGEALQKISLDDLTAFSKAAAVNPKALLNPDLDSLAKSNPSLSPSAVEKAKTEVLRVSSVFNEDQIVAGSILLQSFAAEMHWNQKDAIFFPRTALNAWARGYLLQKISERKGAVNSGVASDH